jgi:hypothetical protein
MSLWPSHVWATSAPSSVYHREPMSFRDGQVEAARLLTRRLEPDVRCYITFMSTISTIGEATVIRTPTQHRK